MENRDPRPDTINSLRLGVDAAMAMLAGMQIEVFTPFTRLSEIEVEGHGLGLSIVQRIVEKLGGQVTVESTIGQGSVFGFTLPGLEQAVIG